MPKDEEAIDEIKALEGRRYRAMIAGDAAVLDELCSDDLIYTHSKADYDDKPSYLHKVGSRCFTYLEITHPVDRILVVDGAALVTGRMTAKVLVAGLYTLTIAISRWTPSRAYPSIAASSTGRPSSWTRAASPYSTCCAIASMTTRRLCAPSTSLNSMVRTCGRDRSRSASSTWRGHYARPIAASSSTRPIPATAR